MGQRRGQKFRSQVRDPVTGKRRSITAATQHDLERRVQKMQETREALKHGEISPRDADRALRPALGLGLTVEQVWRRYREGVRVASQSAADRCWSKLLAPMLAGVPAALVDEALLRKWLTNVEGLRGVGRDGASGYAPRYILLAFSFLAAAYKQSVAAGLLSAVPWGHYRPHVPNTPRYPREAATSFDELLAVLDAAKAFDEKRWARKRYAHNYFACVTMGLSGIRQAEAAGLSWSAVQIDVEPFTIEVRAQAPRGWEKRVGGDTPRVEPKGKKVRRHVLHPSVAVALRYQRDQLRKRGMYRDDGPVFPAEKGKWRRAGYVVRPSLFRRFVEAAGLENPKAWSPHSLRHSAATLEAMATGGDLRWVQARTGHSDLRILETYLHRTGRGLPVSKIPELPARLLGPAAPDVVVDGVEVPALVVGGVAALLPRHEEPSDVDLDDITPKEPDDLNGLARAWVLVGEGPGKRPKKVTKVVALARQRAYSAALYEGRGKEEASKDAQNAKRAALGAWGKALARARRELGKVPAASAASEVAAQ